MNRIIKFRAYDNSWIKKAMIYFSIFDTDEGLYCKEGVTDIRKAEIMQFTGLKDKNGKDIYEGDVLEGFRAREVVEFSTEPESDCDEGGYFYGYHFYKINPSQSEVIGNIYENPNLLNQ